MKSEHWRKLALAASERAAKNEAPGSANTVKQVIARALHIKAARLHARAAMFAKAEETGDEAEHEAANKHHAEMSTKYPGVSRRA